ncbi:ATP-dependent nuclease [Undibacterium sp. Ren11W]|uniref:AAA family ATPase n=1 Tax=Undibacterium sp. Ren11W TaxID=3413045 RepID=UPI003BF103F7
MHTKIWSSRLTDYQCKNDRNHDYISTRKFNLFIGVNNSGKSRLIRTLFSSDKRTFEYNDNEISKNIQDSILPSMLEYAKIINVNLNTNGAITPSEMSILLGGKPLTQEQRSSLFQRYNKAHNWSAQGIASNLGVDSGLKMKLQDEAKSDRYKPLDDLNYRRAHFYIPILRGMRALGTSDDSYQKRTIDDYFSDPSLLQILEDPTHNDKERDNKISIVTGLHLYKLFTQHLLGKPEQRKAIAEYEKLLGDEFFEGKQVTLIPAHDSDTIEIQIGDDPQFPIYNVGDGLQQIIIITSAAYLNKESSLYFIEEPEQSLHAGLIRQLASFLIEHTNHQYFITTHSNHLLDLIEHRDQISIHKVSKIRESEKVQITEYSDTDRSLLDELGVRPSSVYLANCTIWVEGITDRLYLHFFMKAYVEKLDDDELQKSRYRGFLENYHYAFIEYQGGNIAHWNFDDDDVDNSEAVGLCAIRASASAYLICDGDTKLKSRTKELETQLGKRFHILPSKEIENILPHGVIVETAKFTFNNMNSATKKDLDFSKIAGKKLGYFNSDLGIGRLLDDALGLKKTIRKVFAEDSGTIKNKVKFSNTAIEYMSKNPNAWDMTEEIKDVCERIFSHIEQTN